MSLPHVVIIGGGFGGLDAAHVLAGAPVSVTLVDRHNYHVFQPLLYQVATASLSPGDIASPIRWVLRKQKNVEVFLAEARAIDATGRRVLLDPGPSAFDEPRPSESNQSTAFDSLSFDYLIVASGAAHTYFNHPEWEARAPGLKTLDDALEMRRRVLLAFEAAERELDPTRQRRLLTFVIIGGGPTGVELAGALAEIARQSLRQDFRRIRPETSRIVLLEGGPDILPAFPQALRAAARRALERLHVEVLTNALVTGIDEHGVEWRASASSAVERIDVKTILWAAGVAASPLAASIGVPLDRVGRVTPAMTLALTEYPNIFVAGDVCAFTQDGKLLPGVAQVAKQEGAHAARNVLRAIAREPLQPFRYHDYGNLATIGRGSAVADIGRIKASGWIAWLLWTFVHIFWLIGFRNRLVVMGEWAWAYLTFQRRIRLITGEKLWPWSSD
jgi:NADH dehydrogenase